MKDLASCRGVPNRKVLLREAERLGAIVTYGNGGEVRVESDLGRVNLSNRRKDGTHALIALVRKLQTRERSRGAARWPGAIDHRGRRSSTGSA